MAFNPTTPVKDAVVLVIDRSHPRFGDIGKLVAYDWKEAGLYYVEFADGVKEQFSDSFEEGQQTSARVFYRHDDDNGKFLDSLCGSGFGGLKEEYLKLCVGDLGSLVKKYEEVFRTTSQE